VPSQFWRVPKLWQNETAFIIGGGPSGKLVDWDKLRGHKVIAINSSYEKVPFADFLYFADARWFDVHKQKPEFRAFAGRIVTPSSVAKDDGLKLRRLRRRCPNLNKRRGVLGPGLDVCPNAVVSQRTSTQGAMNFSFHLGVSRIVLVAVDMQRAEDGSTHHHSAHPWKNKPGNKTWDIQMEQLGLIVQPLRERGISVANASLSSRIPDSWGWPKVPLESFLA
jgi:hypothetical protein